MAGIGNLAKVNPPFVISYCFKFSVFCHFVILVSFLLTSLFISLIQCWSSISLSLCLIVSTVLLSPYHVLLSKILPVLSNLMCFFLMLILSLSTQVNEVERCFRAENMTSGPLRVIFMFHLGFYEWCPPTCLTPKSA